MLAASIIWFLLGFAVKGTSEAEELEGYFRADLLEYAEIMLFLFVAMSYINVCEERRVFDALRSFLVRVGFTYYVLFWITGFLAFFISPLADNLTTALLMGTVVLAVGSDNPKFVTLACINVVVAANAGGAFSPFGDITTLMVWQKGVVEFFDFFDLFIPSVVVWLVPAYLMSRTIKVGKCPPSVDGETIVMKLGAKRFMILFLVTIALAVSGENFFHLPPVAGMLFGLVLMKTFGYFMKVRSTEEIPFDVMSNFQRIEWDTLLFFYGVIMCVGALKYIGYLTVLSDTAYTNWGGLSLEASITGANIGVGILSSFVDNIPIMFAVLSMEDLDMSLGQWLLVTLTAGVGGSLLSIGSAAGVALMGKARGYYGFFQHLRWTPAIATGYAAGIATHFWVNASLF